ncbi:MAG: FxsA family protein [Rhodobacteraceae bacterium]|nr:FxsA family protein [Paracoccaceae bacterium]
MRIFAVFLLVPLVEIALFVQVGGSLGLWPVLVVVGVTALLGAWLVRIQGARALRELRAALANLENPAPALAHGAMILVAGALLLTPGFFTDAVGFALLIPALRAAVFRVVRQQVMRTQKPATAAPFFGPRSARPNTGDVIDLSPSPAPYGAKPPPAPMAQNPMENPAGGAPMK